MLECLQGYLKVAHSTNVELKAQLTNKTEELRVLKECAFLTEATHQVDVSCH